MTVKKQERNELKTRKATNTFLFKLLKFVFLVMIISWPLCVYYLMYDNNLEDETQEVTQRAMKMEADNNMVRRKQDQQLLTQRCVPNDAIIDCCCPQTCNSYTLDVNIGLFTCRERMQFLFEKRRMSVRDACVKAATEYSACDMCNPDKCPVHVLQ